MTYKVKRYLVKTLST